MQNKNVDVNCEHKIIFTLQSEPVEKQLTRYMQPAFDHFQDNAS